MQATILDGHKYSEPTAQWSVLHEVTQRVDREQFWHVTRNERIHATLRRFIPELKSKSFLEVGCGVANVVGFLHESGMSNLTGWEINPEALAIARKRYPLVQFDSCNVLSDVPGDKQFDIIGHFDFLEHIDDDLDCLKKLFRSLRPGGWTILTVPANPNFWSWHDEFFGHFRRYEKQGLIDVLHAAGFVDVRVCHFMSSLVPLLLLNRKFINRSKPVSAQDLEKKYKQESDLPNPLLNSALKSILRLENKAFANVDLGCGTSLIAIARRD